MICELLVFGILSTCFLPKREVANLDLAEDFNLIIIIQVFHHTKEPLRTSYISSYSLSLKCLFFTHRLLTFGQRLKIK